jgi:hypothetical protein
MYLFIYCSSGGREVRDQRSHISEELCDILEDRGQERAHESKGRTHSPIVISVNPCMRAEHYTLNTTP